MANIKDTTVSACVPCSMITYYGEREARQNGYSEAEISACESGVTRLGLSGVSSSDVQPEADFSREICEICLSPLAGSRFAVTFSTYEPLSAREILNGI